jgi:hypothetical protein
MGLREQLNENPSLTTGVTAGIILIALLWMAWTLGLFGGGRPPVNNLVFVSRDGVTFEAADRSVLLSGQDAPYEAGVFEYGDGEPFIWYLIRYDQDDVEGIPEIRAVENEDWYSLNSESGQMLLEPPPVNDAGEYPLEVLPEG